MYLNTNGLSAIYLGQWSLNTGQAVSASASSAYMLDTQSLGPTTHWIRNSSQGGQYWVLTSWIFIGRTDAQAAVLGPPDAKSQLTGKDPDAGKDWRWEEKGETEDEMIWWHHWLNRHEFEQASGGGEGQGSLVCCSLWGCKESDMTLTEQQQKASRWFWRMLKCENYQMSMWNMKYLHVFPNIGGNALCSIPL